MRTFLFAHSPGAEIFADHVDAFVSLCDGVVGPVAKQQIVLPHPGWQTACADRVHLKKQFGWPRYRCVVGTNGFISPSRQFDEVVARLIDFAVDANLLIYVACPRHNSHDSRRGYADQEERLVEMARSFPANLYLEQRFLDQEELNIRLQACDLLWCWTSTSSKPYGSGTCSDQYSSGTRLVVAEKQQHGHVLGLPNVVSAPPEIGAFVAALKSQILRGKFERHYPAALSWTLFVNRLRQFMEDVGEPKLQNDAVPLATGPRPGDFQRSTPAASYFIKHGNVPVAPRRAFPPRSAPPETLDEHNAAHLAVEFLESLEPCSDRSEGRGIVICAGGPIYNVCAWVTINMLRRLGCKLPIEVWYRGFHECDDHWLDLVEPLGVELVDADSASYSRPHPRLGGWELKPYAILNSRFREVLLLDADNVPVVDPTPLFDTPEHRACGAVLWPDYSSTPKDHRRWRIFGVDPHGAPEVESGQILVDKHRCWRALNLCNWYNERSDFFYQFVHGDKDTFDLAWRRAGQRYAMPSRGIEAIPYTICQHDFAGRRIFQHRVGDKFSLAAPRPSRGFIHEEQCFRFIETLRARWSPLLGLLQRLTEADLAGMDRLSRRMFRLIRNDDDQGGISLRPDGCVNAEKPDAEAIYWCVREIDREITFFDIAGRPTFRLSEQPGDIWFGESISKKNIFLRLAPIPPIS